MKIYYPTKLIKSAYTLLVICALFFTTTEQACAAAAAKQGALKTYQMKLQEPSAEILFKNPEAQFAYVQIIVQVAMNIANRIIKAVMKMKQREMIQAMIAKVTRMGKGLNDAATSGSDAARVAKLVAQPDVDYQAYLNAALEVAKARKMTEDNMKAAAEIRESVARAAEEAAERIYKYNNSRGGEDFQSVAETLVLQDVASQLNNYVTAVQGSVNQMNDVNNFLDQAEGSQTTPQTQTSSAMTSTAFTDDKTAAINADMLKSTPKEQFASFETAVSSASDANKQAADATEAFTNAGNAYVKYLEEKGLKEHPTGDAKADQLKADLEKFANGLAEPYARVDQTSVEANAQLNATIGAKPAPSEEKKP